MRTRTVVLAITLVFSQRAAAQQFEVGVQAAGGTYQEQGPSLAFTGWGPSITADGGWRRFGLWLNVLRISYTPSNADASAEPFDLTQFDGRARYAIDSMWSLEAGYQQQTIAPSSAAQGMSMIPIGGRVTFALAPGARISARADYLAAAKFSGGGSAPFSIEIGLNGYYAPNAGKLRFTVDYAFDRIDRQTSSGGTTLDVPIQSSVVRLGVALAF